MGCEIPPGHGELGVWALHRRRPPLDGGFRRSQARRREGGVLQVRHRRGDDQAVVPHQQGPGRPRLQGHAGGGGDEAWPADQAEQQLRLLYLVGLRRSRQLPGRRRDGRQGQGYGRGVPRSHWTQEGGGFPAGGLPRTLHEMASGDQSG